MIHFIFSTGIALVLSTIITLFKVFSPKASYVMKTSLRIGIPAIIFFAIYFLILISKASKESLSALWPMIYLLLSCFYIYKGARSVPFKTATAVFSKVTNLMVGRIGAGLHWADPFFERVTTSVDGVPNQTIDLQELKIDIEESTEHHTATKGIKAKVKKIVFMLKVTEDIPRLFDIEGGSKTVRERVLGKIHFILLDEIGQILPVDLDEDKGDTIKELAERLKDRVNQFCQENDYPYEIPDSSEVTIGDTELDAEYYKVLARREYALLENQAKDVDAEKLRERIANFGKHILPGVSAKEQTDSALISLGIVKKDIQERKYALDADLVQLAKDIALYFKK